MAQTVIDLTLSTLRDLLVEEVKFLSGVGGQVKDVQTALEELQSYLEDVDRKKYEGPIVVNYIKQIRGLCYQIEDVVETYATDVVLQKRENIIDILNRIACWLCRCCATHEVGTEINSIQKSISNLTRKLMDSGFTQIAPGKEISGGVDGKKTLPRTTYGLQVKKDFVGMQKDIDLLVRVLLNGDSSKDNVVSIYGMGGLGKTTLAKKIYWDKEIRSMFEAFAWVCVSQDCTPKNIFQDLLEDLCQRKKETTDGMGNGALVKEVHKAMQNKKCLVVLDDLWELDHWRCLSPAFPAAEADSKILVTTRKEDMAKIGFFHPLGFLSENESWELLRKKAFARTLPEDLIEGPEAFEPLGKQIVDKCGYLPLAISVIGGVLSKNNSLDHWEKVYKKIDFYLRMADDSEEGGKIKQVLSLSYDDLPFHLKPCFLYLSGYQEDQYIEANEVYLMWMAEGIVSPKGQCKEETLMDVAKRYLRELAGRSMVLVEVVDEILAPEEIQYCWLHDLVRDLCLAKSVEEEFSNLVDFRGGNRPSLSPCSSNGSRRLAMYLDLNVDGVSLIENSTQKLRSLSLVAQNPLEHIFELPQGLINLENLKFLRVLKFYGVHFLQKGLLGGIGNMVHLRYFGFENCSLYELPSCIGELPFLQTLVLIDLFESPRMPNVLWKIKRLKCLYIPEDVKVEGKLALSGLDELEILYSFDSRFCETTELSKLKSLRCLVAKIWDNDELSKFIDYIEADGMCLEKTIVCIFNCDFRSVEGMSVLRKLFMSRNIHVLYLCEDVYIDKLPEYEPGFLPRLTSLELCGNEGFSEDPMGTLEKLPMLKTLSIASYLGKEIVCNAKGFPQLRYLSFHFLRNLETWEVVEGAMPSLSYLRLQDCERLDMIPAKIRSITSLQKLAITHMPPEFVNRVKEGGEDYDKVRHINSIIIH